MEVNTALFITPLIALSLVFWGYFYFRKTIEDKNAYHRYLAVVGLLAFFLNFGWEVAQGPLYKGYNYKFASISFCALASVADMLMVYVLLFGFGLVYKDVHWIGKFTSRRLFWLMLAGGTGAILSEMRHVAEGNWSYAEGMPLLPVVEAGVSPVLQFSLLPGLIFWLTMKMTR